MNEREKIMDIFIDKILRVEKDLEELHHLSYEISESYNTNSFSGQEELSMDKLENLLIGVTHETASQIAFCRNDIQMLVKYIQFRETFSEFTNEELIAIIDGYLSVGLKQDLSKRFSSLEEMLAQIILLKQDWNKTFNNIGYAKIQKQLHI